MGVGERMMGRMDDIRSFFFFFLRALPSCNGARNAHVFPSPLAETPHCPPSTYSAFHGRRPLILSILDSRVSELVVPHSLHSTVQYSTIRLSSILQHVCVLLGDTWNDRSRHAKDTRNSFFSLSRNLGARARRSNGR